MADANWYPVSGLPLGRVRVRVQWAGREIIAGRALNPSTKRWQWCTLKDGDVVWLPPRGEEDRWGDQPACWQPEDAVKWGANNLPSPLPRVEPQLAAERVRFTLVDEAEAADLAREMERDREMAHTEHVTRETFCDAGIVSQWWRDASQIRYASPPDISLRHCEGRVMRALTFCGAGAGLTLRSRTFSNLLREIGEAAARAMAETGEGRYEGVPRLTPLPADHADFELAMGWFAALNPPERRPRRAAPWSLNRPQKVLLWRSLPVPLSFAEIGAELGWKGHQRAQQVFGEAVEDCWRTANGMAPRKGVPVRVDQIAALQERNRAYKRDSA